MDHCWPKKIKYGSFGHPLLFNIAYGVYLNLTGKISFLKSIHHIFNNESYYYSLMINCNHMKDRDQQWRKFNRMFQKKHVPVNLKNWRPLSTSVCGFHQPSLSLLFYLCFSVSYSLVSPCFFALSPSSLNSFYILFHQPIFLNSKS